MGKGGKYLKQAPAKKKKNKVVTIILIVILVLLLLCVGFGVWYYNYLINLVSRPSASTRVPEQTEYLASTEAPTLETELLETEPATTSPEETWPEIVSDENITNIMLVGQASRPGEDALITDTMILVSINREQKTITLTSLMRDLRLVWPKYIDTNGRSHTGHNRINMAYNMGYSWTKNKQDSMDVLESIVSYNFGVEVDRTVEIDFETFQQALELIGGIDVELSQEEITYLQENYPASNTGKTLKPGVCHLSPYLALGYARMRKVGHGDFERTERQRIVITQIIEKLKDMNILEINKLFQTLLPSITTDMTNQEITNYAFEFIPMLKGLKIQSQRIPFDGTYWSVVVDIPGQGPDNQIDCNAAKNGELLRASIGMTEPAN